ncbi:MAG: hypothetical protein WA324_20905, partial [Bryobacteraceae bacterium]
LQVRREQSPAFGPEGDYSPLQVTGSKAGYAIGYLRSGRVAVLVPRLTLKTNGPWRDTAVQLPAAQWRNAFAAATYAGPKVRLDDAFAEFPVALLVRQ